MAISFWFEGDCDLILVIFSGGSIPVDLSYNCSDSDFLLYA